MMQRLRWEMKIRSPSCFTTLPDSYLADSLFKVIFLDKSRKFPEKLVFLDFSPVAKSEKIKERKSSTFIISFIKYATEGQHKQAVKIRFCWESCVNMCNKEILTLSTQTHNGLSSECILTHWASGTNSGVLLQQNSISQVSIFLLCSPEVLRWPLHRRPAQRANLNLCQSDLISVWKDVAGDESCVSAAFPHTETWHSVCLQQLECALARFTSRQSPRLLLRERSSPEEPAAVHRTRHSLVITNYVAKKVNKYSTAWEELLHFLWVTLRKLLQKQAAIQPRVLVRQWVNEEQQLNLLHTSASTKKGCILKKTTTENINL